MCDTSLRGGVGTARAQGLKIKQSDTLCGEGDLCASAYGQHLEIILLGLASHDDVESLIWVFSATLNTAGHILLILIWVQPNTECSGVSSQLRLWFRS